MVFLNAQDKMFTTYKLIKVAPINAYTIKKETYMYIKNIEIRKNGQTFIKKI